ncbi:MAG: hypothetical protein WCE75_14515 [Terracidiphilus sp.]
MNFQFIFRSDVLFARPSFVSGAARVLDLGGVFDVYNVSKTPQEADERAIESDWRAIGGDLHDAMESAARK